VQQVAWNAGKKKGKTMKNQPYFLFIIILFALLIISCVNGQKFNHEKSLTILEFVYNDEKDWILEGFPLEEGTRDKDGNEQKVSISSDTTLEQLYSILSSKKTLIEKLKYMAEITPLYVQVRRNQDKQIPIEDILNRFGKPDKTEKSNRIYTDTKGSHTAGIWYKYGSIMLGIWQFDEKGQGGNIFTLRIDGPTWQKEIAAMKDE
jgi:hypothetical protein